MGGDRIGLRPATQTYLPGLGGKNAQIVMEDADLNLALEGALWGAFGTTGQRCTATSRLILIAISRANRYARGAPEKIKIGDWIDEILKWVR